MELITARKESNASGSRPVRYAEYVVRLGPVFETTLFSRVACAERHISPQDAVEAAQRLGTSSWHRVGEALAQAKHGRFGVDNRPVLSVWGYVVPEHGARLGGYWEFIK